MQSDLKLDSVLHLKTSCLYNRIPAQLILNPGSRQHSDRLSTFRAQLAPSCQHKDHMLEEQQKDFFHQHPFSTGGTGEMGQQTQTEDYLCTAQRCAAQAT